MPSFFKDHLTAGLCVVPLFKKKIWVPVFSKNLPGTGSMYHAFFPLRSPTFCHILRVPGGVRHPSFVFIRQRIQAPGRSPCIIIRQRVREPGRSRIDHPTFTSDQRPPAGTLPANIKQITRAAGKYHPLKWVPSMDFSFGLAPNMSYVATLQSRETESACNATSKCVEVTT